MLGEHNIMYRPRTSVKGQILADFLTEMPDENSMAARVAETQQEPWTLFTDGSSCVDRSGAGLILTSPEGIEFTYALRFQFAASNNEAEYEALIAGLRIAVLVEILKEKSIKEKEVTTVVEEDRQTWMTPIMEYLKEGTLLCDRKEEKKLHIKARQYELLEGVLYRRSFLTPWLRCVGLLQAEYVIREIHEGSCSMHAGACRYGLLHEMDRSKSSSDNHWLPVIPVEIGMPTYRTTAVDVVYNDEELRLNLDLLEEQRERAAIREAKAKLKMTKYYNARVRGVTFRPGDFVYRSNDASHAVAGGKLEPKWEGPYEVTEVLGDGAYKLQSTDEIVLPRTWNIANLKRCYLRVPAHAWISTTIRTCK
uniref:Reverse transcriptase domain-containing protein n=1 Tax=Tanacetum cinerariifolium TaxID=118510 RepID=A0A6L2L246_TANCI|nr:reverse transcriptase domain-containing protein [Tanacetum cinerariifolium]